MGETQRIVLDTNVIISALLFKGSVPNLALLKAQGYQTLISDATVLELVEVMNRQRFDRYFEPVLRRQLLAGYMNACEVVPVLSPIRACRDPKDDKFLEVAVHGRADLIVTGDLDLLALNPFRGVEIVTPAEFMARD